MAVLPVPTPKNVRPGAIALIVAMAFAVTGAIDRAGMATPGPTAMRLVLSATSASSAQRFERIIGLSHTQQKSYPTFSAWTTRSTSLIWLTPIPNFTRPVLVLVRPKRLHW